MLPPKSEPLDALFNPEIPELILTQIDIHTLLLSQRVFRRWRDLIEHSSRLQEALFFKPRKYNGVLRSHLRNENPFVEDFVWPQMIRYSGWKRHGKHSTDASELSARKQEAFLRNEASWRQIYVEHPPGCWSLSQLARSFIEYASSVVESEEIDQRLRLRYLEVSIHDDMFKRIMKAMRRDWRSANSRWSYHVFVKIFYAI